MKIAWFSDFSTSNFPSKSAVFSQLILPTLIKDNEIHCYDKTAKQINNFNISNFQDALKNHHTASYDFFIYQIENHDNMDFIFEILKQIPGIAIIHDLNCKNFYTAKTTLTHPQKTSLRIHLTTDMDNFNLEDDDLANFNLIPYTKSLIRIFTSQIIHTEYLNICKKQEMFFHKLQDAHHYLLDSVQNFTNKKNCYDTDVLKVADDLQSILKQNFHYVGYALDRWDKYTNYRGKRSA